MGDDELGRHIPSRLHAPLSNRLFHYIAFLIRVIMMAFIVTRLRYNEIPLSALSAALHDFIHLLLYNVYQLFLAQLAIMNDNVYAFYLYVLVSIETLVVSISISLTLPAPGPLHLRHLVITLTSLYGAETLYAIIVLWLQRNEINEFIYQAAGGSPLINQALAKRERLGTFRTFNVFLPMYIFLKDLSYPKHGNRIYYLFLGIYLGLVLIIQYVTFVNFYAESCAQRLLAIALTVLEIVYVITMKVLHIVYHHLGKMPQSVEYRIFVEVLILETLFLALLIDDYRCFGSGLREHVAVQRRPLSLKVQGLGAPTTRASLL